MINAATFGNAQEQDLGNEQEHDFNAEPTICHPRTRQQTRNSTNAPTPDIEEASDNSGVESGENLNADYEAKIPEPRYNHDSSDEHQRSTSDDPKRAAPKQEDPKKESIKDQTDADMSVFLHLTQNVLDLNYIDNHDLSVNDLEEVLVIYVRQKGPGDILSEETWISPWSHPRRYHCGWKMYLDKNELHMSRWASCIHLNQYQCDKINTDGFLRINSLSYVMRMTITNLKKRLVDVFAMLEDEQRKADAFSIACWLLFDPVPQVVVPLIARSLVTMSDAEPVATPVNNVSLDLTVTESTNAESKKRKLDDVQEIVGTINLDLVM